MTLAAAMVVLLAAALFFAATLALAIPWRVLASVAIAAIAAYVIVNAPRRDRRP